MLELPESCCEWREAKDLEESGRPAFCIEKPVNLSVRLSVRTDMFLLGHSMANRKLQYETRHKQTSQ